MSRSVSFSRLVTIVVIFIGAAIRPVASIAETRSIGMFDVRKEKYDNGRGDWTEKDVLVRRDGFKLMRIGGGREMQSLFRYTDGKLSFEFDASRYDDRLNPTDTWNVYLGLALKFLSERTGRPISMEEMRKIALNIEDALRAWPATPRNKNTPVRRVRFLMTYWPEWSSDWGSYYELTQPRE